MESRRGVLAVGACLVGVVSGGLALPAARAATETLTQSQFNNKYEIVYNGTPQECDKSFYQNIQGGTCKPYVTLPFVALKDLAAADNVYYRLQRFDIARIKSTADFLAINNNNNARNRVIYDSQYDAPTYADGGQVYCLSPTGFLADTFKSGEGGVGLEFYARHWAYTSVPRGQASRVVELSQSPSESNPDTGNDKNCSGSAKCQVSVSPAYQSQVDGLCVTHGRHAGFMDQLVENDKGGLEYDETKVNNISMALGLHTDLIVGPVTAGLFFGAEMAVLIAEAVGEARDDEPFYPISQSYTWGALKRMTELGIRTSTSNFSITVYGIPEDQNFQRINVGDYFAGSTCSASFSASTPLHNWQPRDYVQFCWTTETTEGPQMFYSNPILAGGTGSVFRLTTNHEPLSARFHYNISAYKKTALSEPQGGKSASDRPADAPNSQAATGPAAASSELGVALPGGLSTLLEASTSELVTSPAGVDGPRPEANPAD